MLTLRPQASSFKAHRAIRGLIRGPRLDLDPNIEAPVGSERHLGCAQTIKPVKPPTFL